MPVKVYDGTDWVTVAGDGAAGAPGVPGTSSSINTWVKTASGGETSVSGAGDTGYGTLAYTAGQELVYLNGVLLDRGDDYTATNGTSIAGLTALTAGDVITVWTVNSFSVANTYTQAQSDARYPAKTGSVLQVVSATTSTSVSNSTITYADTGLSVSITPSSATSKILVMVTQNGLMKSAATSNNAIFMRLLRDATQIAEFFETGLYTDTALLITGFSGALTFLDSPATTSAVTYKTQFRNRVASAEVRTQSNNALSSIVLLEIGA